MIIDLNRNWLDLQTATLNDSIQQSLLMLRNVLVSINLKLANYRQTTAVLREEGIESLDQTMRGSGYYGGCMCESIPFEYRPQYQNRMFY